MRVLPHTLPALAVVIDKSQVLSKLYVICLFKGFVMRALSKASAVLRERGLMPALLKGGATVLCCHKRSVMTSLS